MFEYDILQNQDFTIVKSGKKIFYNTDGKLSLSDYLKSEKENTFVTLVSDGNSTEKNLSFVHFTNEKVNNNNRRYQIGVNNFEDALIVFTVRKLVNPIWSDMKDEYLTPEVDFTFENQFVRDSLIYSLFNPSSGQKSLDNNFNQFFWMSRDRMKELADNMGYDELYNDARTASDRHVYKLLFGEKRIYDKLSPDAKAVLDKATELVELSMEMRQVMANDENHLNSWDAGYAQLKLVWKEYFPEQFKEFRQLYKNMEDRMRPLVYELGFLMQ
jgi:hypothetical protein